MKRVLLSRIRRAYHRHHLQLMFDDLFTEYHELERQLEQLKQERVPFEEGLEAVVGFYQQETARQRREIAEILEERTGK